jgi:aminoglycoside phosphotransferase (APT) family kinase protein
VQDIKSYKTLSGLSFADVILATKDGKYWFVRKIAKSISDNERLKIQADKQSSFKTIAFKCPNIFETGELDGKFYFDMAYIKGPDAAKYLSNASYKNISQFGDFLCEYIDYISNIEINDNINNFTQLKDKLLSLSSYIPDTLLSDILSRLDTLKNQNLNSTLNHGDLTLENIIISANGTPYLLDFLNSNFNHYWQDVSKLYQDLSGGWYQRKGISISKCANDFLGQKLYKYTVSKNPLYESVHNILICYNFIRILPYVKTIEDKILVEERIKYFGERV